MSGAPGIETAIGGSPTGFVLAKAGTPPQRVRADRAGGAQDIMRLPACAPLLTGGGGVPSVTIRGTFSVMSVARIEGTAVGGTSAAIDTNGVTSAASGATVAQGVMDAMIVVWSVVVNAAMTAGKTSSVRSAAIPVMTPAESAVAIVVEIALSSAVIAPKFPVEVLLATSIGSMTPVADRMAATAHAEKPVSIVDLVRRAAAEGAIAATPTIVDVTVLLDASFSEGYGLRATPGRRSVGARLPE